jgi:hypothetical protein
VTPPATHPCLHHHPALGCGEREPKDERPDGNEVVSGIGTRRRPGTPAVSRSGQARPAAIFIGRVTTAEVTPTATTRDRPIHGAVDRPVLMEGIGAGDPAVRGGPPAHIV